jgi:hypothetical protein
MLYLFTATLFTSAALLFVAEPMMGKLVLPLLGGSPAVWNSCVMFFQLELLVGYLCAHAIGTRLSLRRQFLAQLALVALGAATLPLAINGDATAAVARPIGTVMSLLVRSIGLPLLAVAATAPLLQRWFASTRHQAADDPFFLYAASNLGSLIALFAYPLAIEPWLALSAQRRLWTGGYLLLATLIATCAWMTEGSRSAAAGHADDMQAEADGGSEVLTIGRRARWVLCAFVPSSLMLSVTSYISTDIAAVPLLWVVPLALYLTTYVLAFARRSRDAMRWIDHLLPLVLAATMFSLMVGVSATLTVIPLHLTTLFVVALVSHVRLASDRPSPRQLTTYYVWISIGGLLGGVFNTLIAPVVFTRTLEYPAGLALAAFLRRGVQEPPRSRWSRAADFIVPVVVGAFEFEAGLAVRQSAAMLLVERVLLAAHLDWLSLDVAGLLIAVAFPLAVAVAFGDNPRRFGLTMAAFALVAALLPREEGKILYEQRSFFGTQRVTDDGSLHVLAHGTTMHGSQSTELQRRCTPLSYYWRQGPVGQMFASFTGEFAKNRISVVGLGSATLAAYSQPDQDWTFFEINPGVVRIAQDPKLFTFLRDCIARYRIVVGDARLEIGRQADGAFDLMVFDAFNSDAIPLHLMTREALRIYFSKLSTRGIAAFHVSNRYLDLAPVLAALAEDAGLVALTGHDTDLGELETADGHVDSDWVVVARRVEDLGSLTTDDRWHRLERPRGARVWTDDYSDVLSTLKLWSAN